MNLKIIYAHATTSEHQYNLLLGLAAKMSEEPFKLLVRHCSRIKPDRFEVWMVDLCECLFQIVHLVIVLFRVDFTGRELAERQVDPETIKSCKSLFCSLSGLRLMNSELQ